MLCPLDVAVAIFLMAVFFRKENFFFAGPRENRFTPCGPGPEMSLTPLLYNFNHKESFKWKVPVEASHGSYKLGDSRS